MTEYLYHSIGAVQSKYGIVKCKDGKKMWYEIRTNGGLGEKLPIIFKTFREACVYHDNLIENLRRYKHESIKS